MNNQISVVDNCFDIDSIRSKEYYFAHIKGEEVSTKEELLKIMQVVFQMPDADNWDAVADWLSDLDWLNKNGYILYVTNYDLLLKDDLSSKETFLEILRDTAEWWSGDVEKYVVDGKKKSFNVYLVD